MARSGWLLHVVGCQPDTSVELFGSLNVSATLRQPFPPHRYRHSVPVPLPDVVKSVIDRREFATVATLQPDGAPQLSVVWITRDGDDLLFSTVEGRRKHTNLLRDPRIGVLVYPRDDPYFYIEVRGTASMTRDGGAALIDALAAKYHDEVRFAGDDGTDHVRVVVRVTADKVLTYD
jgi:PPOX class probable F420-dependent enzyme